MKSVIDEEALYSSAPYPTKLPALIEQHRVAEHRNLFCPSYDPCLDIALAQRWPSWTCSRCVFFAHRYEAEELIRVGTSRMGDGAEVGMDL